MNCIVHGVTKSQTRLCDFSLYWAALPGTSTYSCFPASPSCPRPKPLALGSVFMSPLVLLPVAPSSAQWGPEDAWPPLPLTGGSTHGSWFPATPTCCLSWASAGLEGLGTVSCSSGPSLSCRGDASSRPGFVVPCPSRHPCGSWLSVSWARRLAAKTSAHPWPWEPEGKVQRRRGAGMDCAEHR